MNQFSVEMETNEVYLEAYPVSITCTLVTTVRVIRLGINATIVDDELEGIVHKPSIASLVVGFITIHKFLLRQ